MDEKTLVGYHGTKNDSAIKILDTQFIEDSKKHEEWLGKGKYFYNRHTNAIEYIMRKYNENNGINKPISYNNLIKKYSILETKIECDKIDILDLDEITLLSKFVWAWEQIYNIVKDNEEFKQLIFRDGFMIDYMINEVVKYKVVIKTFDRIIKDNQNRKKENVVFDKTRIVYEVKQKYICVKDETCIGRIEKYEKDFQQEYNSISRLDKIVNRRLNYEV